MEVNIDSYQKAITQATYKISLTHDRTLWVPPRLHDHLLPHSLKNRLFQFESHLQEFIILITCITSFARFKESSQNRLFQFESHLQELTSRTTSKKETAPKHQRRSR
jgi:hypothetical protein